MKATTFLHALLLFVMTIGLSACNDEDDTSPGTPSGGLSGMTLTEEGANLTFTYPDGTTDEYNSASVFGWDSGQLLNLNYWRGFRVFLTGGEEDNTLYFRWNLPQGADWREEMQGENALNNQRMRLEWTSDLSEEWVEMYRPNGNDPSDLAATGTVDISLDEPTTGGIYDVIGEIDGEFNINGQYTTVTGRFWKKEM